MPRTASQPSGSGKSRKKNGKARANTEEEHSQRYDGEGSGEDVDMEDDDGNMESAMDVGRKAADLIRLAMSTEYRRLPLKRDEITKKIFGGRPTKHQFDSVFNAAQEGLKNTFGMELCELMSRAEKSRVDAALEGANENGEMKITGVKKKASSSSSRQYMLRSVLDAQLIEAAGLVDMEIEEAERREREELYPNEEEPQANGTLIDRGEDEEGYQLALTGVLHVILALILVNGRVISDMQLKSYLKRLHLPLGAQPQTTFLGTAGSKITIDAYLVQLVKQSYLEKQKANAGPQKRARGGGIVVGEDGESNYEWRWGSRAIAEIGEEGIGEFIADFMETIEALRRSSEDADSAAEQSNREADGKREKMLKAVGRAAGGGLQSHGAVSAVAE